MEQFVYDPDNGQMLSGSFMDYAMPHADAFPRIEIDRNPIPTKTNPLGVKGAGECGTVGALPAAMNAINNALAPLSVRNIMMPATPAKIWEAVQKARALA